MGGPRNRRRACVRSTEGAECPPGPEAPRPARTKGPPALSPPGAAHHARLPHRTSPPSEVPQAPEARLRVGRQCGKRDRAAACRRPGPRPGFQGECAPAGTRGASSFTSSMRTQMLWRRALRQTRSGSHLDALSSTASTSTGLKRTDGVHTAQGGCLKANFCLRRRRAFARAAHLVSHSTRNSNVDRTNEFHACGVACFAQRGRLFLQCDRRLWARDDKRADVAWGDAVKALRL